MPKTHFHAKLEARINAAISDRSEALTSGAIENISEYKFEVGFINGLRTALSLADEIQREDDRA